MSSSQLRSVAAMKTCEARECCWDNSSSVPCFQTLPSYSHSSRVKNMDDPYSGTLTSPDLLGETEPSEQPFIITGDQVQGHVMVKIGGDQGDITPGSMDGFSVKAGCPGHDGADAEKSCSDNIFTFDIGPDNDNGEVESFIRSQFGPIIVSPQLSEISLYLPGPRLITFGLESLIWRGGRQVNKFLLNQQTSVHLPSILGR